MSTYALFTEIKGGWIVVIAEVAVLLMCSIFLYHVLGKQDIGAHSRALLSTGFFSINIVAYEILVSAIFFPGDEYFNHGAEKSLVIHMIVLTIPIILTAAITLSIRILRSYQIKG